MIMRVRFFLITLLLGASLSLIAACSENESSDTLPEIPQIALASELSHN